MATRAFIACWQNRNCQSRTEPKSLKGVPLPALVPSRSGCQPRCNCAQIRRAGAALHGNQIEGWRLSAANRKDCMSLPTMMAVVVEKVHEDIAPSILKHLARGV